MGELTANISITSSKSMFTSFCAYKVTNPFKHSSLLLQRVYDFRSFMADDDHPQLQFVNGNKANRRKAVETFGKKVGSVS